MPLTCRLETERGEVLGQVNDNADLLHELLPDPNDDSFHCLRFIDWYGDTIFNRPQAERMLAELDLVQAKANTPAQRQLLQSIEDIARQCRDGVHLYVKFCGD